jgi:hypothetical protein
VSKQPVGETVFEMNAQQKWALLLQIASHQAVEDSAVSLTEALQLSRDVAPEVLGCSVTEMVGPNFQTPASSGPLAQQLDTSQYVAGAGPCVAAARDRQPQNLPDIAQDQRYPQFSSQALNLGVRCRCRCRWRGRTDRPP